VNYEGKAFFTGDRQWPPLKHYRPRTFRSRFYFRVLFEVFNIKYK